MKKHFYFAIFLLLALYGCQAGRPLSYREAQGIQRNVTTEQQIRQTFGEPTATHLNMDQGTRMLLYRYRQSDAIKKPIAGLVGSIAGGILGNQVGGGSGQAIATMVGATAGGAVAGNAVTTREHQRTLQVIISLATSKVVDYHYTEDSNRSQPWTPSASPEAL